MDRGIVKETVPLLYFRLSEYGKSVRTGTVVLYENQSV